MLVAAACASLAVSGFNANAQPAAAGGFARLAGTWSGTGTISLANGTDERIRCRVYYNVDTTGTNLRQTLRCASDSYRLDVDSNLVDAGGSVSGSWSETTRNVAGDFTGRTQAGTISGAIAGPAFTASFAGRSATCHDSTEGW
jgi:hypothetical protein